jgi:uncharacterized protein YrrD
MEVGMKKLNDLLGLPVVCEKTNKTLGIVHDMVFDLEFKKANALISKKSPMSIMRYRIKMEDVIKIEDNVIYVTDEKALKRFGGKKDSSNSKLLELKIFTRSGEKLGTVGDVLLDTDTWGLEGVEVSDGLMQDFYGGRRVLPLFGRLEFSEESLVVGKEDLEEMTETGGGIKQFFN